MLLHQGAAAFTLWTGQPAPVALMQEKLAEARAQAEREAQAARAQAQALETAEQERVAAVQRAGLTFTTVSRGLAGKPAPGAGRPA